MTRLFRWTVDLDALTDEAYAFVTDPRPSRNERPVIQELHDINPETVDVLESMLIDGTEERRDVADYIDAVFGPYAAR
ncbi:MAG TPA: hypothetical protein VFI12_06420 [Thermomicrobiales bacterium]|jgi:wyosine [tRNA(Phe)-imidazoG37] synthetase (radical SAM superfamily)|nr:hypothetical protein [Thermomicrobiales bacterium]